MLCDVPKFLTNPELLYPNYPTFPADLYDTFNIFTVEVIGELMGDLLNDVLCSSPPPSLEYDLNCD